MSNDAPKPEEFRQAKMYQGAHFIIGWVTAAMAVRGRRITVEGRDGIWIITNVYDGVRTREELIGLADDEGNFTTEHKIADVSMS